MPWPPSSPRWKAERPSIDPGAIRRDLLALGFDRVGFAAAGSAPDHERYAAWLDRGFAGSMAYLAKHRELKRHTESLLPTARSLILVSLNYRQGEASLPERGRGRVSRYARGRDYHKVLRGKLRRAGDLLLEKHSATRTRICVDSAPLLERSFAAAAGLGWIGKNTLLIDETIGSFTFLGALLTDLALPPDAPVPDRCGSCTACLEACPTAALRPETPGWLDARRCISTLTIEAPGSADDELAPLLGDHLFGCDICQEVCPWNRRAPETGEPDFQAREGLSQPLLEEILAMDEAAFLERFAGTAVMRAGLEGMQRNARIALANQAPEEPTESD
jgi:epoxyqueuosine reductase